MKTPGMKLDNLNVSDKEVNGPDQDLFDSQLENPLELQSIKIETIAE